MERLLPQMIQASAGLRLAPSKNVNFVPSHPLSMRSLLTSHFCFERPLSLNLSALLEGWMKVGTIAPSSHVLETGRILVPLLSFDPGLLFSNSFDFKRVGCEQTALYFRGEDELDFIGVSSWLMKESGAIPCFTLGMFLSCLSFEKLDSFWLPTEGVELGFHHLFLKESVLDIIERLVLEGTATIFQRDLRRSYFHHDDQAELVFERKGYTSMMEHVGGDVSLTSSRTRELFGMAIDKLCSLSMLLPVFPRGRCLNLNR